MNWMKFHSRDSRVRRDANSSSVEAFEDSLSMSPNISTDKPFFGLLRSKRQIPSVSGDEESMTSTEVMNWAMSSYANKLQQQQKARQQRPSRQKGRSPYTNNQMGGSLSRSATNGPARPSLDAEHTATEQLTQWAKSIKKSYSELRDFFSRPSNLFCSQNGPNAHRATDFKDCWNPAPLADFRPDAPLTDTTDQMAIASKRLLDAVSGNSDPEALPLGTDILLKSALSDGQLVSAPPRSRKALMSEDIVSRRPGLGNHRGYQADASKGAQMMGFSPNNRQQPYRQPSQYQGYSPEHSYNSKTAYGGRPVSGYLPSLARQRGGGYAVPGDEYEVRSFLMSD
ncbi:unnamed protein product [Protopolystoma xenopodis]|uniref:Uncharacterized protein n=1 Tax=Protopolystoma xenopodis TaxID=117903 RepID=A0A3S5ABY0_9PLAT|nr:unnamed protein product [Protopolystoma xenopodis]